MLRRKELRVYCMQCLKFGLAKLSSGSRLGLGNFSFRLGATKGSGMNSWKPRFANHWLHERLQDFLQIDDNHITMSDWLLGWLGAFIFLFILHSCPIGSSWTLRLWWTRQGVETSITMTARIKPYCRHHRQSSHLPKPIKWTTNTSFTNVKINRKFFSFIAISFGRVPNQF